MSILIKSFGDIIEKDADKLSLKAQTSVHQQARTEKAILLSRLLHIAPRRAVPSPSEVKRGVEKLGAQLPNGSAPRLSNVVTAGTGGAYFFHFFFQIK